MTTSLRQPHLHSQPNAIHLDYNETLSQSGRGQYSCDFFCHIKCYLLKNPFQFIYFCSAHLLTFCNNIGSKTMSSYISNQKSIEDLGVMIYLYTIPILGREKQEDQGFKASLRYMGEIKTNMGYMRFHLKKFFKKSV